MPSLCWSVVNCGESTQESDLGLRCHQGLSPDPIQGVNLFHKRDWPSPRNPI